MHKHETPLFLVKLEIHWVIGILGWLLLLSHLKETAWLTLPGIILFLLFDGFGLTYMSFALVLAFFASTTLGRSGILTQSWELFFGVNVHLAHRNKLTCPEVKS